MDTDKIKNIINQGEGLTIEFKRAKDELPANLFETVCAFLNRNGGTILLGVNDDKTIEGVNPLKAEELCKHISNLSNNANKPHNYGQLTPKNFEPFPKNPHIAQIFTQMGRSEELGTGIRKVYKYSKAYSGNEHIEFIEQDVFVTIVPLENVFNDGTNIQKLNTPDKGLVRDKNET